MLKYEKNCTNGIIKKQLLPIRALMKLKSLIYKSKITKTNYFNTNVKKCDKK